MADPIFPVTLPRFEHEGYSGQRQSPFARTSMDSGLARQRRRFISVPKAISAQATYTAAQLAQLESFWDNELSGGVAWFLVTLVSGGRSQQVRARFTEAYQEQAGPAAGQYVVQVKLEVLQATS